MAELILFTGVMALLILGLWLVIDANADSDDDNGGGGLMQPVLIPVPVRRHR
jgi:hypothetical protein